MVALLHSAGITHTPQACLNNNALQQCDNRAAHEFVADF
jgi:hypothetical protein